jgi:ribosomal protein L20
MGALHKADIEINRKVLADLAVNHPQRPSRPSWRR